MARLEAEGLRPAPEADRATLCRRLYVVLTGLPPDPAALEAFEQDDSPDPVATLTDRLLASPRFGERWGRHWLDVVRYADSVTLRGFPFRQAWRYRDYVIASWNADRPFDAFVREQVAGDLYPAETLEDRQRGRVATTFWMLGDTNLEEQDKRQLELDVLDEQLDVLSKAFLAQTITCARCHDHKFDPVPARDYHALAGILSGMSPLVHANVSEWTEQPLPGTPAEEEAWAAAAQEVKRLEAALKNARSRGGAPGSSTNNVPVDPASCEPSVSDLETALALARAGARRPLAMAPADIGATNLPVLRRGNWRQPVEAVPRGVWTAAFETPFPECDPSDSGRRSLAAWLVDPENPLTARVWVNRIWHWVFGKGLVPSVDNFGTTGDHPSHPELLDTLAVEFMSDGWSSKRLIRRLVTSHAFRRSGDPADPAVTASLRADPGNRWLGRWQVRRVEAEVLRDSMLAVAGKLDLAGPSGPSFPGGLAADYGYVATEAWRSVYLPMFRNALPESLTVFDLADPGRVTGARERAIIAPQALFLLNHPFVMEQAAAAAEHVRESADPVERLWRALLGRPPSPGERDTASAFIHREDLPPEMALAELAHALMGSVDFRNLR